MDKLKTHISFHHFIVNPSSFYHHFILFVRRTSLFVYFPGIIFRSQPGPCKLQGILGHGRRDQQFLRRFLAIKVVLSNQLTHGIRVVNLVNPPKWEVKLSECHQKNNWFCTLYFYPRFFWEGNSTGERLFWPCTWAVSHQVYPRGFSSIALAELQRFMAPRWVWEKFHVQNAGDEQSRWFCKWRQWEMFCKENGISWQGTTLSCYDFKTFCVSRYSVECLEEWMFREPTAKSQVSAIAPAALRRVLQCLGTCWGLLHFGICIVLLIVVSNIYSFSPPLLPLPPTRRTIVVATCRRTWLVV